VVIADEKGNEVANLGGPVGRGLQQVVWDLRVKGEPVKLGEYTITLKTGDAVMTGKLKVEAPK